MGLDELSAAIDDATAELEDSLTIELNREMTQELAMLMAVVDSDPGDMCERAIHVLYQSYVDMGKLDFHLRSEYDVMYDEFLSGMTFDEMTGSITYPQPDDERRYQF